jgi:Holliday junction DNA helicase RuvA
MIARLKGLLEEIGPDWVVIDVSGVGYLVYCPGRVIGNMPGVGEAVALYIETHVWEDHIHLYGFANARERETFRMLTRVQGVGAKVGLAILGTLTVDELTTAIVSQDKAMLSRPDGVGPRLAARLMTELKDKIVSLGGAFAPQAAPAATTGDKAAESGAEAGDSLTTDAISALVNLGYGRAEAFGAVSRVVQSEGVGIELNALIPAALKELGR